jgi:hypothetical protein
MSYNEFEDGTKTIEFSKTTEWDELSPLHQISPKQGQTLRIALLTEFCKPKAASYHWYRNGFYRCNTPPEGPDAECCAKVQRSWTCVCLALLYLNADSHGNLARYGDIKCRIGYVSLAKATYAQASGFESEAPGCDLHYSKDEYYHLSGASRVPVWKETAQAEAIANEARRWEDGKKLIEKLGKKITNEEWTRLIKTGTTAELDDE